MKGFGIYIQNDLLEPKHVAAMQDAIWLFMWLEDKVTSIDTHGDGVVLGGKEIKYSEVATELGVSQDIYTRWVGILIGYPYIKATRAPHGIVFKVLKTKKRIRKSAESEKEGDSEKTRNVVDSEKTRNVLLQIRDESNNTSVSDKSPTGKVVSKKEKRIDDSKDPLTQQQFSESCKTSKHRHIQIIGNFADEAKYSFTTKGQWRMFITRNVRPARQLAEFTDGQIANALKKMYKDQKERPGFLEKWGLETIIKYLK